VCPEELGGLPTPRPAAEITGGDGEAVLDGRAGLLWPDGTEVTAAFLRGAEFAVEIARRRDIRLAVLKSRSPSCGAGTTHIDGAAAPGLGVTAAALRRAGIRIVEVD
jgi:uncharacterized protein YbbK (DUF523 family)